METQDTQSIIDDSDDDVISDESAELEHLVQQTNHNQAVHINESVTTQIIHHQSQMNWISKSRESIHWSEPTDLLLDSHSQTSLDTQQNSGKVHFTTNYNKSGYFSCITRWTRGCFHSDDPYARLTLIATKDSKTTNCIHGVKQNAMWTKRDKNTLRFFIPTQYNDQQLPMKMLIELWDHDYYSFDNFRGSKVVDVGIATNSIDIHGNYRLNCGMDIH